VVVIAKDLTPELVAEGLAREVVHVIQTQRKALDLDFTDRIDMLFATESADLRAALGRHLGYIESETLAASVHFGTPPAGAEPHDIDGHPLAISITKSNTVPATKSGSSA
jgi:isoleucyl-tRNA synthetase